jgi:hypothetical protein
MFSQPIGEALQSCNRILLAGCGGGYDVLGAVPIAHELIRAGKHVEFASLSFTTLARVPGHRAVSDVPHLYTATADAGTTSAYCPEAWLSAWLGTQSGRESRIWCFDNVGVAPLRRAYEFLVRSLDIDAIVLIDGGVDSILRGDETSLGTPSEDFASLAAVEALEVPTKVLACIGFGAELRDGICHAQVLERVAELTAAGALLGMWPLVEGTPAASAYQQASQYIADRQKHQHGSHIHSVVGRSMRGDFGSQGAHVWLSPLSSIYWFFDATKVAATNLILEHIADTKTLWEVAAIVEAVRKSIPVKLRCVIPL